MSPALINKFFCSCIMQTGPVLAPNMPFPVTKPVSGTTSREEARVRLKQAVQAYEEGEGSSLSISQAARL